MSTSESRWVSWAQPRWSLVREGKEGEGEGEGDGEGDGEGEGESEGESEGEGEPGMEVGLGLRLGLGLDAAIDLKPGKGMRCASTSETGYALGQGSNVNVDNVGEVLGDVSRRASSEGDISTSRM